MADSTPTTGPWWRNDAVVTATLVAIAALGFTVTHFINKSYQRHEDALARRWYQRGETDLSANNPQAAVADFRTAIIYSHDNGQYRLRLAEALAANDDTQQAIAYFTNLWEQQPGSGPLNLYLARLYARSHQPRPATQHYNAAIYGVWSGDPIAERRRARIEYIDFLQQQNLKPQAQAEAVALTASVPLDDIAARFQAAALLLRTGDLTRALSEYLALVKNDPATAYLGAGQAAYQLQQMRSAARYLQSALQHGATDPQAKVLLQNAQAVINSDPNQRHLTAAERSDRIYSAYDRAGERLRQCAAQRHEQLETIPTTTGLQQLYAEWQGAAPKVKKAARDSDLRDSIMDLVFRAEQTAAGQCGDPPASSPDWALLVLSRQGGQP
jgi:outer membrane protein assembly factor BamD (BamD/ComL family)